MVWVAISKKGKSEICVNEWGYRLNQDGYIEILEKNLIPFADNIYDNTNEWKFLQDNAPIHRGKKTMLWLEE